MTDKQVPEVGKIIEKKRPLKYVMTALGGTFVWAEEGEDDEATQLL
jgi:hypothetical protein